MRSLLLGVVLSSSLVGFGLLAACGDTTTIPADPPVTPPVEAGAEDAPAVDSAPPVDNGAPSTNYPAPHPPLPELVNMAKGKVLATPKVYMIYYPGYEHEAQLEMLAKQIGATPYWTATTAEYGVGPLTYLGMLELTGETAPTTITSAAIETLISTKLAAGDFGAADPNAIYTIVFPKTTTITMAGGGPFGNQSSCSSFGGYHGNVAVSIAAAAKKNFAFAVLPTCDSFGGLGELDGLTGAMSHELVEAVTDPFPSTRNGSDAAFSAVDQDHFIWIIVGGSESADLCAQQETSFYKPQGLDFVVQRSWSNKLAKASHDPCAPNVQGVAYFNSAPVLNEDVQLDLSLLGGGQADTKGVKIPVGKSKVIEVDLFSDAATSGPWTVTATDTVARLTGQAPTLDFAWDRNQGVNGEKLHLTVTVKSEAALVKGAHPFTITSTLGKTKVSWPSLVTDQ